MAGKASIAVLFSAAALLAACGKPSGGADQPASPSEPASAPTSETPPPTDAEKKAALADLPAPYQTADLDNGQAKLVLCKSCHTVVEGGADMTGPNLYGVFGRKAGSKPGFNYSDGVKALGYAWDAPHIDAWITNPKSIVPGTKMSYIGMKDAKDRTDLIAYLKVATTPRKPS